MLENAAPAPVSDPSASGAVKRYSPPNQRNRYLSRRKSGDRYDRNNGAYGNDGDKVQHHANHRQISVSDHGDVGASDLIAENFHPGLIPLEGCCQSEASQLLNDRWAAVMHNYNDPSVDLSERPVMYSGSNASAWGQFKLPHQLISSSTTDRPSQMDFSSELLRAIRAAGSNSSH